MIIRSSRRLADSVEAAGDVVEERRGTSGSVSAAISASRRRLPAASNDSLLQRSDDSRPDWSTLEELLEVASADQWRHTDRRSWPVDDNVQRTSSGGWLDGQEEGGPWRPVRATHRIAAWSTSLLTCSHLPCCDDDDVVFKRYLFVQVTARC